ncbi:hypothetical protein GGR57DRAFT_470529 [Xylariaceae sp. FL1272]|nr:hypothetical protein GGR57DRAFT_470529 [Xylariaceae sp. FL1272]
MKVRSDETITQYLGTYATSLANGASCTTIGSIDLPCIEWLAAFHMRVARPLAILYTDWALRMARNGTAEWKTKQQMAAGTHNATTGPPKARNVVHVDSDISLSRAEELRIFRALYRYQTFQHLFGRSEGTRRGSFQRHENNELFFCIFDPWEVEEIGCMDIFLRDAYEILFKHVKVDLHPRNPRFRQSNGLYNPTGSLDIDAEHGDLLDGMISLGLTIAMHLLAIKDHDHLVFEIERHATRFHNQDASVEEALGIAAQFDRRDDSEYTSNTRDEAEKRRDSIQFIGDLIPPRSAPFAWVALWGGRYSNLYGEYVPSTLRRCSYVMWDQRRWADMGVDESLIVAQWDASPGLADEIELLNDWRPDVRRDATIPMVESLGS